LTLSIAVDGVAITQFVKEEEHGTRTSTQNRRDIQYPVCPAACAISQDVQMGQDPEIASRR
jgi:hypothetical protein